MFDKTLNFKMINYNPDLSPVIYALWHGRQFGLLGIYPRDDLHLLISKSNDGELISRISKGLGFSVIRGSHNRGGTEALIKILRTLRQNKNIAFTVDGPRGPIYKVKEGIIKIAQLSQAPIVPVITVIRHKIQLNSWDQYQLPFFFTNVVNIFGDPIYVPRKINEEEKEFYRLHLENKLLELSAQISSIYQ
ncbi:MAG: lysophospholipid acyltransferase family protein [bacterium]